MNSKFWKAQYAAVLLALSPWANFASAADTYIGGRITNVAFSGDIVLIMLDSGVPDNCIGTPFGWMVVPAQNKPMIAFVLGLWMRGDASQVSMTVYTSGRDGSGYCQINQIDPVG